MRKKVLIVATITRHIVSFHLPFIKRLKNEGYEVHVVSNNSEFNYSDLPYIDKMIEVPFDRNPFSKLNIKSYFILKKIISEENYDIIHTHTPVSSVISRIALKHSRKEARMVYTSHGFHFYEGSPSIHWLIYYNLEKYLSKFTNVLITINKEDYKVASEFKNTSNKILLTNGVGIDFNKFKAGSLSEKERLRVENNLNKEDFILFYAAELNDNKNHIFLIENLYDIFKRNSRVKLILAGSGPNKKKLISIVNNLKIQENVIFLGQRRDVHDLLKMADLLVSSSKREGLPTNIIEGLATGIPCVVSNCRGNRDLIKDGVNGFIYKDKAHFQEIIRKIINDNNLLSRLQQHSQKSIIKYDINLINNQLIDIYKEEIQQTRKNQKIKVEVNKII